MSEIMTRHKVRHWLSSANVLGALRFNAVLPVDDDVDWEVYFDDFVAKRAEIERDVTALNWTFDFNDQYTTHLNVVYTNPHRNRHTPFIDLFLVWILNTTKNQSRAYGRPSQMLIPGFHVEMTTKDHNRWYVHHAFTTEMLGDIGGAGPSGSITVLGDKFPVARQLGYYLAAYYGSETGLEWNWVMRGPLHAPGSLIVNQGKNLSDPVVFHQAHLLHRWCVDNWRYVDSRKEPRAMVMMLKHLANTFGPARFQENATRTWNITCDKPVLPDVVQYCKDTAP